MRQGCKTKSCSQSLRPMPYSFFCLKTFLQKLFFQKPFYNSTFFSRLIFAMAVILPITLVNLSCSKQSSHPSKADLVILGSTFDFQKTYIKRIIAQYKNATGRDVFTRSIDEITSNDGYDEKFKKSLQNPNSNIDLFIHSVDGVGKALDKAGIILHLTAEGWKDELAPGVKVFCEDGKGQLLGLPFWERDILGCYYNKTMFDRFGLKKPEDQKSFDVLCATLFNIGVTPLSWSANFQGQAYCAALDPIFFDNPKLLSDINNERATFSDIKQVRQVVDWVGNAYKEGWFGHTFQNCDLQAMFDRTSSGECAMIIACEGDVDQYLGAGASGKYKAADFSLMPIFLGSLSSGTYQEISPKLLMINSHSKKQALAKDFLAFCADKENYDEAFRDTPSTKVFLSQSTLTRSPQLVEASDSVFHNLRHSTVEKYIDGLTIEVVSESFKTIFTKRAKTAEVLKLLDSERKKIK